MIIVSCRHIFLQDGMVTMHDVLDAQWQIDNAKDGIDILSML